jgi:arylsulfatase
MIAMGIIKPEWKLPRSDASVPPWNSLCEDEKVYWSKVMEVYAAAVDRMDQGIGKVIAELERTNQLDNTLIMFLSDNGGSAEEPNNSLNYSKNLTEMGNANSFITYGPKWANVSNVPFRYFKHYEHEGGISTPFIARYPTIIKAGTVATQPAHLVSIMATCLDISNTKYPSDINTKLRPLDGVSLKPAFRGENTVLNDTIFFEHLGFRALRLGDYKIVSLYPDNVWSLYNMVTDRSELQDLSKSLPAKVVELNAVYQLLAKRGHVTDWSIVSKLGSANEIRRKAKAAQKNANSTVF